jgi:hypothetical protein
MAAAVAAETRLDPADLVNAAIDALIRERCELPPSRRTSKNGPAFWVRAGLDN